ncbi:hypothetical protein F0266_25530 [Vibrio coralliilyticus]|uniref:hypothetical protein n=1 Tax=Vibrio coralliilyticus TaxID=190893 RepID=UPI00148D454B|nr:hypothetical protein [Vibrio coralliilyticus]NOH56275.1 hypothetical protein [Vibrio coralliilyticus]
MARLGICQISNLKLSEKSRRSVSDIKEVMKSGNLLSGVLAATPFYYIFGTPSVTNSAFEKMITIRETDWDTFGKAMIASSQHTRNMIFSIAYEREIYSRGDERRFWNCVSELSK